MLITTPAFLNIKVDDFSVQPYALTANSKQQTANSKQQTANSTSFSFNSAYLKSFLFFPGLLRLVFFPLSLFFLFEKG